MASIADNPNPNPNQEPEQSIIPVLTVFKNKSILKNIFIVLNNNNDNDDNNNNNDHTLLVGRHPNCNIVLTHPSISRFHLQIRFTPSSRSISLLDLSSVHGTWVSGRKLEHGVSVELKE
ncbi:parallel spindle, partial [Trifolium pratense]